MFVYCNDSPVAFEDSGGRRMVSCVDDWNGGGGSGETPSYEPINGQSYEPYGNMPYGISTIGFSGCEAIAIYNALLLSGKPRSFNEIKSFLEDRFSKGGGYGLLGLFGADYFDICSALNYYNSGFNLLKYDDLSSLEKGNVMIIGFWTKTSIMNSLQVPSIHTIAVRYDGDYYVYNMYNNIADVSSYKTASSFVKKENYIYGFLLN